jgi:DNA-binding CsgD family transcriptional regulator
VARARGDNQQAAALFGEGLALFREHEDWRMAALALAGVAGLAIASGEAEAGARLLGAAAALRELGGIAAEPAYRAAHERDEAAARAALGERGLAAAWAAGQATSLEVALAEASAVLDTSLAVAGRAPDSAARHGLTPRELEILPLLVEGRSDRQIAEALSISHRTVMRHITHLLAKLDVESRTAAATQAVRRGLV